MKIDYKVDKKKVVASLKNNEITISFDGKELTFPIDEDSADELGHWFVKMSVTMGILNEE